jgi:hypothetical protein
LEGVLLFAFSPGCLLGLIPISNGTYYNNGTGTYIGYLLHGNEVDDGGLYGSCSGWMMSMSELAIEKMSVMKVVVLLILGRPLDELSNREYAFLSLDDV